jgi:hypothetical protein
MPFELPNLPYSHDALAPHMSKETLEYHHDKHHQAYVTNGNNLLKGTDLEGKSTEEVVKQSYSKNATLFNNAGQHYNHIHFWQWMKKGGGGKKLPAKLQAMVAAANLVTAILIPLWLVVPAVAVSVIRRRASRCDDQPVALLSLVLFRAPPTEVALA